jgi:glycerate dehydrogenase
LEAAAEKGVVVTNVPDYSSVSVAQHTLALLLALTSHVQYHSDTVKKGKWCLSKDFCYWDYAIEELADKTMGLIGFGNIGQRVAKIAQALGMKIIVYRSNSKPEELEMLFRESDVISLHCPLNQETVKIINAASLAKMKKSVFLINTSRGGLINEQDLANALNEGQIAGAGLDVLVKEPASVDTPLLKAKNCVITPHIAWASVESRARLIAIVTANVEAFLKGSLQNVI